LPVFVRGVSSSSVLVKGRASGILSGGTNNPPLMRIANISEKGITHLVGTGRVQVEFVMMSTKVAFVTSVVTREDLSILVLIPQTLVSVERRKNSRYLCNDEVRAFLDLSAWRPQINDLAGPPFYPHGRNIAGFIPVADVSQGGVCGITRFPTSITFVKRGLIDDKATIILPMIGRIPCSLEIRWVKKIKEHQKGQDGKDIQRRFYRFGAQFVGDSDILKVSLRQFMTRLSEAGAI